MDALIWHRVQFAFTASYHYLFPQLTMGLALLVVVFKSLALNGRRQHYDDLARFWAHILGINFVVGVVTGIPLEFEFGTNWGRFSDFCGGIIGTTLAMEGMFAFFAESAFLGLLLFGEKMLSRQLHFFAALMVFFGAWTSGYFIIVTNAFMQHPVGYTIGSGGHLQLSDFWAYLFNPWAIWEYLHTMCATTITGSFVVAAVAAYWLLMREHEAHAQRCLKVAVIAGLISSVLQIFPTGDQQGKLVSYHQTPALAAMEGKFESSSHAELAIIGQPNLTTRKLENPLMVPSLLSYLAYGSFGATVKGMNDFHRNVLPDNVVLLYYAYHIMVGLGTIFILLMSASVAMLPNGHLYRNRLFLWLIMLAFPFPYIATTAGWMVAELGRQPWVIWGLLRTADGTSPLVSSGNIAFTALGFAGLYALILIVFFYLVGKQVVVGPVACDEQRK